MMSACSTDLHSCENNTNSQDSHDPVMGNSETTPANQDQAAALQVEVHRVLMEIANGRCECIIAGMTGYSAPHPAPRRRGKPPSEILKLQHGVSEDALDYLLAQGWLVMVKGRFVMDVTDAG